MGPKAKLPKIVQRSFLLLTEKFQTQKWNSKMTPEIKKNFLAHKECPDWDFYFEELPSKLSKDRLCFWSRFSKRKNKTQKWPLKIPKEKKASNHKMSENRPSPNMPILHKKNHWEGPKRPSELSKIKHPNQQRPHKHQQQKTR